MGQSHERNAFQVLRQRPNVCGLGFGLAVDLDLVLDLSYS